MHAMNAAPLLDYLRHPFPRARGFSPYRFPGLIVHVPVALCFLVLGASLTLWDPYLWPLLVIYLLTGIYLGRDLALHAHHNPLITLALLGGFIALMVFPDMLRVLLSSSRNPFLSIAITLSVAAGFCAWVRWHIGVEDEPPATASEGAALAPPASAKPRLFASGGMWLIALAWLAVVFIAAYRPEHPRSQGFTWAIWLLPLIAAVALALAIRSNAVALHDHGVRKTLVLVLKLVFLLLVLAVPTTMFVTSHADFRLHARVAKMMASVSPLEVQVQEKMHQGLASPGAGIAWPLDIKVDTGLIGSDGTILIFDASVGALLILAPGALSEWRCLGYPRALAPRVCRDYPGPTSLEDGSTTSMAQAIAVLSQKAADIKAAPSPPPSAAAQFLAREGDLDFGYVDAQGRIVLYNDRHGVLMLLTRGGTGGWECSMWVHRRPGTECPSG